jgi:NAD(P)-dependent dehydrogenase (short-subunit alcohol dehydrogenase family)
LAIVAGASSGIGYYLAKQCAERGFDLLIAADEPEIKRLRRNGGPTTPRHGEAGLCALIVVSRMLPARLSNALSAAKLGQ